MAATPAAAGRPPTHSRSPSEYQSAQSPLASRPASHGQGPHPSPVPDQAIINPGGMPPPGPIASVPSPGTQSGPVPTPGAPGGESKDSQSPGQSQPGAPRDLKTSEHYETIANAIRTASPSVVRQVIRDHWDRCFLGSEYHTAFVLNAMLHQASPATLNRAIQDFGAKMVQTSKSQLIEHFTPADFDQTVDMVLSKATPYFLDRALAQRLETIDARSLVNALARAERLGYDVQDIVQEKTGDGAEHVIPSLPSFPAMPSSQCAPEHASQSPTQLQWAHGAQGGRGILVPPGGHPPSPTWYNTAPPPAAPSTPGPGPTSAAPPHPPPQIEPPPTKGPPGIHYCQDCYRPCSGKLALQYHIRKRACDPHFNRDKLEKTICIHCGCTFGSATGALYHMKSEVCGKYSIETKATILNELRAYSAKNARQKEWEEYQALKRTWERPARPPAQSKTTAAALSNGGTPRNNATVSGDDPYAHLTADARRKYQEAQAEAEEKYGRLMREAMSLPEPERTDKLSKLKNSYNTKQSTTRKRFGIRLRERRTKEDIEAERVRLLGRADANEVWLEQERAASRLRLENEGRTPVQTPVQSATLGTPSGQGESPRKRVPLSEMGGLSGSVGSAETTDPTAYLTSSQPRGLAQLQSQGSEQRTPAQQAAGGTNDDAMSIDGDNDQNEDQEQSQSGNDGSETTEGSSSSDDDDIPATR